MAAAQATTVLAPSTTTCGQLWALTVSSISRQVSSVLPTDVPARVASRAILETSLKALIEALKAAEAAGEQPAVQHIKTLKAFLQVHLPQATGPVCGIRSLLIATRLDWPFFLEHAGQVQEKADRFQRAALEVHDHLQDSLEECSNAATHLQSHAATHLQPREPATLGSYTAALVCGSIPAALVVWTALADREIQPRTILGGMSAAVGLFLGIKRGLPRAGRQPAQQISGGPVSVLSCFEQYTQAIQKAAALSRWVQDGLQRAGSRSALSRSSTELVEVWSDCSQLMSFWEEAQEAMPRLESACRTFCAAADKALHWSKKAA